LSWKFLSTDLDALRRSYEKDLAGRVDHAKNELDAQRLLDECRGWEEFNRALLEFEERGSDPTSTGPVMESGKTLPGFYEFKKCGFTAIYLADANTETAILVLFYRDSAQKEWVSRFARLLAPGWRAYAYLWPYLLINLSALVLGLGGVIIAVHNHSPSEGGRGGIFATVVAFVSLFCDPDEQVKVYEVAVWNDIVDAQRVKQIESQMKHLVRVVRANSRKQTARTWATVIGSGVGTIFWGFGDVFAHWLSR